MIETTMVVRTPYVGLRVQEKGIWPSMSPMGGGRVRRLERAHGYNEPSEEGGVW